MVHELKTHRLNGLNDSLVVEARDNAGVDGACHLYRITVLGTRKDGSPQVTFPDIRFQDGNVEDVGGVNGISDEALLAVVEHRLEGFQSGKYACEENEHALISLQNCILWLKKRVVAYQDKQLEAIARKEKIEDRKRHVPELKPLTPTPSKELKKVTRHANRSHDGKSGK